MPLKLKFVLLLLMLGGCRASDEPTPDLKGRWERVRIDSFYYNALGQQLATSSEPGIAAYIVVKDSTIDYFQVGNTMLLTAPYKRVGNQLIGPRLNGPQYILELTPHRLKLRTGNIMMQRGDTARFEYDELFIR